MRLQSRAVLPLTAILLCFATLVFSFQRVLPVLEGNDEHVHMLYVFWLQTENRLPERANYRTNPMLQETGQPPLYYWTVASLLNLARVYPESSTSAVNSPVHNRWFAPLYWGERRDNFNAFMHGENEALFGDPILVQANRIGRLVSLFCGLVSVLGAYGAATEFFHGKEQRKYALLTTAFFALTPQAIYLNASVTNDSMATMFATLTLWHALRLLRRGPQPGRVFLMGLLLGLAGLSKVNTLLTDPHDFEPPVV